MDFWGRKVQMRERNGNIARGMERKKWHTFLINMYRSSGISGARPVRQKNHSVSLETKAEAYSSKKSK